MASFGNIIALFLCIFVSYTESTYFHKKYYQPGKYGYGKMGAPGMYPGGKGGFFPGSNFYGPKFNKGGYKQQYYPVHKKVPIVKKVPVYRKVPVYNKVVVNKPVYVPVYRDIPVPQARKINPRAWQQGDFGGPNVDIGLDIGGPNVDLNLGAPDMGGFGLDVGLDLGFDPGFGDLGLGVGLGEFRAPAPAVQQRPTETVVTSNIQITDADHVTTNSNTNSANSQFQSSNMNLQSNLGIHDADHVNMGGSTGTGSFGGVSNGEFGLDAGTFGGAGAAAMDLASLLGPQGLDPGVGSVGVGGLGHDPFGAGGSHGGAGFDQGVQGGVGTPTDAQLASILAGLGAGQGQDQLATSATHQGQQGMLTGEPFAIVSMGGQGSAGGAGHGPADLGVHGGHGMSHSTGGHGGHV